MQARRRGEHLHAQRLIAQHTHRFLVRRTQLRQPLRVRLRLHGQPTRVAFRLGRAKAGQRREALGLDREPLRLRLRLILIDSTF